MRIFFVLDNVSGRGGVETVVTLLVSELIRKGHEAYVFLPTPSDDLTWEKSLPKVYYYYIQDNYPRTTLEYISEKSIGLSALFGKLKKPDFIVGTHVPQASLYSRIALGYSNSIPVISWLHSPPEVFYDPHFINYADVHWAISRGIENKIKSITSKPSKVYWIGNPVNIEVQSVKISNDQKYIYIGRLENSIKRLDVLFNALAKLNFKWTLDVYGSGPDESYLHQMAKDLHIENYINFNGWISNPWQNISEASVLALTSDFEGFGMVVAEALARGIPVISTDCAGPRDLIQDGYNGWLVPKGDIQAVANAFVRVNDLAKNELLRISESARSSVSNFTMEQVLKRIKDSLALYIPEERWGF